LRGDYLAIVTLGFGEIVPLVFKNLSSLTISFSLGPIVIQLENVNLTGGVQGINPIDPPFLPFFNILFDSRSGPLAVYLGVFLLAIAVVVARNLQFSRMGRAWVAIREDETAAQMMGVNTVRSKLLAFALGASLAGVAGSFQASYLGATTSDFFEFSTSILVLIMVILGGVGNVWGVIVGAIALTYVDKTFLPYLGQRVQDSPIPLPNPAQYNFLVYGIILLVMMRFRPQGFLPDRQREAELSVAGLAEADVAMGMPVEIDNVSVAPPGQEETGPDARKAETIDEARDL
jgi:branched-chain amino acid transport system permease protein